LRLLLSHHQPIPRGDEVAFHAHEHVLDGVLPWVTLLDRRAVERVLQVAQDHQALLQDAAVGQFEHRQRGGAARLRDVDDHQGRRHLADPVPVARTLSGLAPVGKALYG